MKASLGMSALCMCDSIRVDRGAQFLVVGVEKESGSEYLCSSYRKFTCMPTRSTDEDLLEGLARVLKMTRQMSCARRPLGRMGMDARRNLPEP